MGIQFPRLNNRYNIPLQLIWLTIIVCLAPSVLNLAGVDFSSSVLVDGRFVHVILVSLSIPIAFLTVVLAFVDYSIKKDISIPIMGVALFCAGLLDTFHILAATNLVSLEGDQGLISQFTWIISRTFQALILMLGTAIFLVMFPGSEKQTEDYANKYVISISTIFVLLTFLTVNILLSLRTVPDLFHSGRVLSNPFDLIPIALYLISGLFIFPAFYRKYPSRFSQTLLLSLFPAILTEFHMSLSTFPRFDNHYNIAHFLQIVTYLIPFIGLSLNYLQTHRNERAVIETLDLEIQERLLAEDLIKGIFNSSLNGILAFRAKRDAGNEIRDFTLLAFNRSSREILAGIPLSENVELQKLIPHILPLNQFSVLVQIAERGTTGTWEHYATHIKKWLSISAARFGDGLVMTFGDVTSRKRAEQELIVSEKMALTGRFARTIGHEIRNPLTNITLSAGQLKGEIDDLDGTLEPYFEIIKRNCQRINQLISELLNSTKPEDLRFVEYPVSRLLQETLAEAMDRIKLKEIALETRFDHKKSCIFVDPEKMKIALLNVIINAVEAMEPKAGRLRLQTRENDGLLTILVGDNGTGIKEENLKRLFEPFYTSKSKGTGLGLTSAQNIIHNHKGTIGVESSPGVGTEFQISFPVQ